MAASDQAGESTGAAVKHPAKYSKAIKAWFTELIQQEQQRQGRYIYVLDPFAGVGGIHDLPLQGCNIMAIELEPEWAMQSDAKGWTWCGDFFEYDGTHDQWDVVATSCTYGNRMADHHNARDPSKRNTYKHTLGRDLSPNNSGGMQWGDEYRDFHNRAWQRVWDLMAPGGLFILNISDHIRKGDRQPVTAWHVGTCKRIGFIVESRDPIFTQRFREGENHEARVANEWVITFRKPA